MEWPSNVTRKQWAMAASLGTVAAGAAYLFLRTNLIKDLGIMKRMLQLKREADRIAALPSFSFADLFEETVQNYPDHTAIIFLDDNGQKFEYTFKQLDEYSNLVANWALRVNLGHGDVVAVMLTNRPDFLFTWLGLCKAGCTIALINHNLRGYPLVHSLSVSNAQHYIVGDECLSAANEIRYHEKFAGGKAKWYSLNSVTDLNTCDSQSGFHPLSVELKQSNTRPVDRKVRAKCKATDTLFYIYTSGTTGPPKASIIKHLKFSIAGTAFAGVTGCTAEDRIYCTLPLYHSAGGMIGVGSSWRTGATLIFRPKFSAKNFWKDCTEQKASIIQYIGELCRYLVVQPESPWDQKHSVRVAMGNGLRPDVWPKFVKRFNIPHVVEFYAATEGNAALMNDMDKVGAVGYLNPMIRGVFPVKIVKFDVETEEPVRNKNGFCIECADGEVGELIAQIVRGDPLKDFHGYTNKKATEKKILRNVFKKGDAYFRSGDLLKIDSDGFVYFVDRIGDTFRWKGENVATSEVAEVMSTIPGLKEVNIYGVSVPHHDGRAGMACMVVEDSFDMKAAYDHCMKELPSYAAPLFLRVQEEIQITSTFKHQKRQLQTQGFNPDEIAKVSPTDKLFIRNDQKKTFVPLTKEIYEKIHSQISKL